VAASNTRRAGDGPTYRFGVCFEDIQPHVLTKYRTLHPSYNTGIQQDECHPAGDHTSGVCLIVAFIGNVESFNVATTF
jgi:hypothetical protein